MYFFGKLVITQILVPLKDVMPKDNPNNATYAHQCHKFGTETLMFLPRDGRFARWCKPKSNLTNNTNCKP